MQVWQQPEEYTKMQIYLKFLFFEVYCIATQFEKLERSKTDREGGEKQHG